MILPLALAFVREGKTIALWIPPTTTGLTAQDICIYGPGDLK